MDEGWLAARADLAKGAAFAALFTVGAWAWAFHRLRRMDQSDGWPATWGRVSAASVEEDDEGHISAEITYVYTVAGVPYEGSRVSFGAVSGELVREVVQMHRARREVPVLYNPADPSDAVLGLARTHGMTRLFILPVVGLAVTGWLVVVMLSGAG